MSSYKHFTLCERKYLQELLSSGYGIRKCAAFLGRSPSSVSREIQRNRTKGKPKKPSDNPYQYHHWRADTLAKVRRRDHRRTALPDGSEKRDYVCRKLEQHWSPEAIAGRWYTEHPDQKKLSASTIYRYIHHGDLPNISAKKHLRRRGKRKVKRDANYNSIQPERIIPEWPEAIRKRERIGDWEGDTVYGGVGKGLIVTLVDRKTRFLRACLVDSRNAALTADAICTLLKDSPVKSISLDNGSEFALFRKIEEALNTEVYFAEPHKPWQRGTNENTNGLIRFYFPKGFDFHGLTQDALDAVIMEINLRPRKCLNWLSPYEAFYGVALA